MSRHFVLGCLLVGGLLFTAGCGGSSSGPADQKAPSGVQLKERPAPGAPGGGEAAPAKKGKAAAGGGVGSQ